MPATPPDLLEVIKAVATVITAGVAVYGVHIAELGLDKWRRETIGKRKAELAEDVLADAYQAHDIIARARFPGSFSSEGKSRTHEDWETPDDSRRLDAYYVTAERLNNNADFFAQLRARKYRFITVFGKDSAKSFDEIWAVRSEVITAVHMLIATHRDRNESNLPQSRRAWEAKMGWGLTEDDEAEKRLKSAIESLERICKPAIDDNAQGL